MRVASWSADISRLKKANARPRRFLGEDPVLHVPHHALGRVEREIGGERCLAHAGTAGKDDEVGMVEAAGLGVDRLEAGGDARQAAAGVERLFRHLHGKPGGLGKALHGAFGAAFLRDPVERRLGLLDLALGIDVLAGVEGLFDHLAADADQRPEQRQLVDLAGEIARADDRRAAAGQLGEVGRPAQLLHLLVRLEQRPQGDRRGDHVAVDELQDLLVDAGVERLEEMLGPQSELDVLGDPVVDHQRAEQRAFRLDVVRKSRAFGCGRIGRQPDYVVCHGALLLLSEAGLKPASLWNCCG
jgi:hypothetical protein